MMSWIEQDIARTRAAIALDDRINGDLNSPAATRMIDAGWDARVDNRTINSHGDVFLEEREWFRRGWLNADDALRED